MGYSEWILVFEKNSLRVWIIWRVGQLREYLKSRVWVSWKKGPEDIVRYGTFEEYGMERDIGRVE